MRERAVFQFGSCTSSASCWLPARGAGWADPRRWSASRGRLRRALRRTDAAAGSRRGGGRGRPSPGAGVALLPAWPACRTPAPATACWAPSCAAWTRPRRAGRTRSSCSGRPSAGRVATVDRVVQALLAGALIAVPSHGGRRGHPGGFARADLAGPPRGTCRRVARGVLADHPDWIVHVPGDPGCLAGIDTPEDYARLIGSPP